VSAENVEIVREALRAFNRRDGPGFDALLAANAEVVPVRAAIETVVYSGSDAGSQYCSAVDERWENLSWKLEGFRDGGDWVLGLGHIQGRGRDSGARIDARGAWVVNMSGGKIVRFQTFSDRGEALRAVGLEE
jgi:ketosteroid isomerase-like protein